MLFTQLKDDKGQLVSLEWYWASLFMLEWMVEIDAGEKKCRHTFSKELTGLYWPRKGEQDNNNMVVMSPKFVEEEIQRRGEKPELRIDVKPDYEFAEWRG